MSSRQLNLLLTDQKDLGVINHVAHKINQKTHNLERQRIELWVIITQKYKDG